MSRIEVQFVGTLSFEVDEGTTADDYSQYALERAITNVIIIDLEKEANSCPEVDIVVEDISLIDDCYDDDDWDDDYWDDEYEDDDEDWEDVEQVEED